MRAGGKQFSRQTTADAVAEHLRGEIQRGELGPGTRLRQGEVAARFGVSTTPVREAFALLQADGLLRIDPHRGAIVFHPSVDDVREFYEIREALETLAVSHAIPHLDDALLDSLQGLVDDMRATDDQGAWTEMNETFHLRLYEASGRPRLCNTIANLRDASSAYIRMFVAHQAPGKKVDDEHQAILDACRARDTEAAIEAVGLHMRHSLDDLTRFIELSKSDKQ